MTTILADLNLGLMVADSQVSDGDRLWTQRKVWRYKSHLLGFAGNTEEVEGFLVWWRAGCVGKMPRFDYSSALVMSVGGLVLYTGNGVPQTIRGGVEAIGSGAKAAMCVYEAIGWQNPAKVVGLVCKHDAASRKPVRTYKL